MAKEHWYVIKVRPAFVPIVTQKLCALNLQVLLPDEVIIPNETPVDFRQAVSDGREHPSYGYVYCRFALEDRLLITSIPGVLDILGAPEPIPVNGSVLGGRTKPRFCS
jgi:transcription antitermination factor NusG